MRVLTKTLAVALLAAVQMSAPAYAGSCPEEHVLTEPRDLPDVQGKGVKVEIREQIDMTGWREMGNFKLRTRHFVIQPGGQVPVHDHVDRPSIIYFVSGEILEHNALCAVPIPHKAGETAAEFGPGQQHWWSNEGTEPVVLVSSDVIPFNP